MKRLQLLLLVLLAMPIGLQAAETSWTSATLLENAVPAKGTLSENRTEDWYKIEVPSNGEVTITATPYGTLDLYFIELYALNSENSLSSRGSEWKGKEPTVFTVKECAKGTYYLVVRRNTGEGEYLVQYDFKATDEEYADDIEPNNSWQQAQSLPLATNVTGHLGYFYWDDMDNEDWFKVEVPENGEATITVIPHGDLDLYFIELYALDAENGLRSRGNKWNGKEPTVFTVKECAKGTYYLVVRRNTGQGAYTLRCNFKATAEEYADDIEPNNSWQQAQSLPLATNVTGHLGYFYWEDMDNEDWFKIEVPRNGTIQLNYGPYYDLDLYFTEVFALDAENKLQIRANNWTGKEQGEIVIPDAAPGTYYVVMKRNVGQGAYSLQYRFIQNEYASDTEPNNVREQAIPIEAGITVAGHLGYLYYNDTDNEDWYQVSIKAKGTTVINVKPTEELDMYFTSFYDSEGTELGNKWIGKEEGTISVDVDGAGIYYICVRRNSGQGTYFLCCNGPIGEVEKLDPLPDVSTTLAIKALQYEVLPNMNVARKSHASFATANGDIVVVGGHTVGFSLTSTAERLHNGQWESVTIGNPHDNPSVTTLPDGHVLVCGGYSSDSGVGQSTASDIYDPETHTFTSTGRMTVSRAACAGAATGFENNVLISGNWYNSDNVFELWNGSTFTSFGEKSSQMHSPFVVSNGNGIVYVFGCWGTRGGKQNVTVYKVNTIDQTVETLTDTGLENYVLWNKHGLNGIEAAASTTSNNKFLFLAKPTNDDAAPNWYLMQFDMSTEKASKLVELPSSLPDITNTIYYSSGVLVNKSRKEAYVIGQCGVKGDYPLLVYNYNLITGQQTLYKGGHFEGSLAAGSWTIQPTTGNIILTGGCLSSNLDIINTAIAVKPFSKGGIILGDANGDGVVDVADVVTIVNYILEKPGDTFVFEAADINHDGTIDVSDVVNTVNIILMD